MHTRAAVAAFDAEPSNKIVTSKATSDRSMSRPFPTDVYWYAAFCVGQLSDRFSHAVSAEQRNELAPFHSMTSSARASSVGGISRPSAFAVLSLITSANLVVVTCAPD